MIPMTFRFEIVISAFHVKEPKIVKDKNVGEKINDFFISFYWLLIQSEKFFKVKFKRLNKLY